MVYIYIGVCECAYTCYKLTEKHKGIHFSRGYVELKNHHQEAQNGCNNQGGCNIQQPPISLIKAFYALPIVGGNTRSQTLLTLAAQQASSIQTTTHERV